MRNKPEQRVIVLQFEKPDLTGVLIRMAYAARATILTFPDIAVIIIHITQEMYKIPKIQFRFMNQLAEILKLRNFLYCINQIYYTLDTNEYDNMVSMQVMRSSREWVAGDFLVEAGSHVWQK